MLVGSALINAPLTVVTRHHCVEAQVQQLIRAVVPKVGAHDGLVGAVQQHALLRQQALACCAVAAQAVGAGHCEMHNIMKLRAHTPYAYRKTLPMHSAHGCGHTSQVDRWQDLAAGGMGLPQALHRPPALHQCICSALSSCVIEGSEAWARLTFCSANRTLPSQDVDKGSDPTTDHALALAAGDLVGAELHLIAHLP